MKIVKLSKHIWGLKTAFNIQAWLVKGQKGLILVDTGLPSMAKGILYHIEQLQEGPLELILLTHGHPDHVGGLEQILQTYPVPVFAHQGELPYIEGSVPYPPFRKTRTRVKPIILTALPADDNGTLLTIQSLTPYFTPGHSPGHVVYYHEPDRVLIAGDLFMTRSNKLRKPFPFVSSNMKQAIESGSIVKRLQPDLITVAHGKDLHYPHEQYDAYRERWSTRYFEEKPDIHV